MDEPNLTLAFVLIGAGFLLLVLDLLVPTGGILTVLSLGCIVVGVVLAFTYGNAMTGLYTLVGVFVLLPVMAGLMFHFWPKTPIGRRFFLTGTPENATVAATPFNQEMEALRGRFGRALSALRPAGVVDFDGRRIDALTEGMMVERGQWVRCIDVRAGKVIVRPVDKPNLGDLETADFR
jgi:membrane-bound serine protease (ClpP class)